MPNYIVTGKLGGGKTLVCVGKIQEALLQGKRVATNLDLNLTQLCGRRFTGTYIRLPDKPTIYDFEAIGFGNTSYDEEENGLLVLDELGTWFDSRGWQDKERIPVNNWMLHMRKLGWDGYLIIQDVDLLDSKAKRSIAEMTAFCRRTDRIRIPFIGWIGSLLGRKWTLPKLHIAKVVYGTSTQDLKIDRWVYRGRDLYSGYDTKQMFSDSYPHAVHSVLSPWHLNRNSFSVKSWKNTMRLTKIVWRRFASPIALGAGFLFGVGLSVIVIAKDRIDAIQPKERSLEPVEKQEVQADIKPESLTDPYDDRIAVMISKLHIAGSRTINNRTTYELVRATEEGRPGQRMTNFDLARMGLDVRVMGSCQLDVSVGDHVIPIFCDSF